MAMEEEVTASRSGGETAAPAKATSQPPATKAAAPAPDDAAPSPTNSKKRPDAASTDDAAPTPTNSKPPPAPEEAKPPQSPPAQAQAHGELEDIKARAMYKMIEEIPDGTKHKATPEPIPTQERRLICTEVTREGHMI